MQVLLRIAVSEGLCLLLKGSAVNSMGLLRIVTIKREFANFC